MDFIEEAKKLGFSDAAVMKTDKLVFVPEYRVFCEENACGNYDKNPACPPESGTVEEMKERALGYENTLVLQTTQDRLMDYRKAKLAHNKLTEQLSEKMKECGKTDILIMSHALSEIYASDQQLLYYGVCRKYNPDRWCVPGRW